MPGFSAPGACCRLLPECLWFPERLSPEFFLGGNVPQKGLGKVLERISWPRKITSYQRKIAFPTFWVSNNKNKKTNNNVDDPTVIKTPKMKVVPRTENQRSYIKTVLKHDVNFGIGPAGTGKTFIAVACAVAALEAKQVNRIILIRPIVEAGERLGFLPGDIAQKIDPYLRPLRLSELL